MDKMVSKWAPGASCAFASSVNTTGSFKQRKYWTDGPVLSQTDLYLLNTELEVNPILEGKVPKYQLQFHLVTGLHR